MPYTVRMMNSKLNNDTALVTAVLTPAQLSPLGSRKLFGQHSVYSVDGCHTSYLISMATTKKHTNTKCVAYTHGMIGTENCVTYIIIVVIYEIEFF